MVNKNNTQNSRKILETKSKKVNEKRKNSDQLKVASYAHKNVVSKIQEI